MSEESIFDADKIFCVYEYCYDSVKGEYTNLCGNEVAFVEAPNMFEALDKAGCGDTDKYGAMIVYKEDLDKYSGLMKEAQTRIGTAIDQLDELVDKEHEDIKKLREDRECPNGCGKMDKKFRCKECGFGYEQEKMLEDLKRSVKVAKRKGEDVSEIEKVIEQIEAQLDN
jgi:hypothetical protein